MPRGRRSQNAGLLEAALVGFEQKKKEIDEQIAAIRSQLGVRRPYAVKAAAAPEPAAPRKRRKLSAAARKRIAAAQRKRWAEHRKSQASQGGQ